MPLNELGDTQDPITKKQKRSWITNEVLYELSLEFYNFMLKDAIHRDGHLVWEGSMSRWFIDGGQRHLYSPVTKLLYAAGCCNLASRGGGTKPSLVHLHHAPSLKEVITLRDNEFFFEKDTLTGKAKWKILEQMVNNQRTQIADLLERVERLERYCSGNF